MQRSVCFLAFTVTFVIVLQMTTLLVSADETSAPPPATDTSKALKNYTVFAYRGIKSTIRFKALFKRNAPPGMVVTITSLPSNGKLVSSNNREIPVGGNADGNNFVYTSNSDFPADGQMSGGIDAIGYRVDTQGGTDFSGFVLMKVSLLSVQVHNYTLTSINSEIARTIVLRVREGAKQLTLADGVLASVQLETLPSNGCSVKQFDGTPITTAGTTVTDVQLRIMVTPRSGMQDGETCEFAFTATRRNGNKTPRSYVTLKQFGTAFPPRAYATNSLYNVEFDSSRMLELVGSTRNPRTNLTFVITKLPSIGQVYDVADSTTEQLPEFGFNASSLPITLYTGPKSRVVLMYKVSPALVKNTSLTVTLEYIVKDKYKSSLPAKVNIKLLKEAPPTCGATIISPVFWDKPVKDIVLNFTNPNGRKLQKLILMTAPANPIGDILYRRATIMRSRQVPVVVGGYFSDSNNRLSYQVRAGKRGVSRNETYTYRAQGFDGLSCTGSITFIVMQHDAVVVPQSGLNIRRELVRLDSYTLLPLWGTANKTVAKPSSVVISMSPDFGTIYQLLDTAPYETGRMYRVNLAGLARSYCTRHDCAEYRGPRVDVGDKVVRTQLTKDESLDSQTRFWILYKAPSYVPDTLTLQQFQDKFEYHFFNDNGEKSEIQRVTINFRKRLKRIITCRYKANPERNYNFDHQQQTFIKCTLSNDTATQAVMIPEFDKYRRHGAEVNFRMFQFRQDANRIYTGDRLANSTKSNVVGMWLDRDNSLIVVPSARARQQNFQFRAIIYNTSSPGGELIASTKEEVRVIVTRENTPPEWVWQEITGTGNLSTPTATMNDIDIVAFDADDDLLQFRLAQGVTKGVLYYEENRFGLVTSSIVKTGSVLRVPKAALSRQTVRLQYKVDGRPGWTYPTTDSFTLYADDGGSILSEPLVFNITITNDETQHSSSTREFKVSYSTAVVALITIAAVFIIVLASILRRRNRQKYMTVPRDDVELN